MGYDEQRVGYYRILDLDTGIIHTTRDVQFNEQSFTFRGERLSRCIGQEGAYEPELDVRAMWDNVSYERQMQAAVAVL